MKNSEQQKTIQSGRTRSVLFTAMLLMAAAQILLSQGEWPYEDSLRLESAKNDTASLRSLVNSRKGDRIAARAQNRLGRLAFEALKNDEAEREFLESYRQKNHRKEKMEAAYHLGVISFRKDNPKASRQYLTEFLNSNPDSEQEEWARYFQVRSLYREDNPQYVASARDYLNGTKKVKADKKPVLRYDLIRYFTRHQQFQEALDEANKMIRQHPDDPLTEDVKFQAGDLLVMLNRPKEAVNHYSQLVLSIPATSVNAARAQYQLGAVYDSQNDFGKAMQNYRLVQQKYPSASRWVVASRYSLAMIKFREGIQTEDSLLIDQSYVDLKSFIADHPEDRHVPRALMALADLCVRKELFTEAVETYDQILSFNPELIPLKPKAAKRSKDVAAHNELVLRAGLAKGAILQTHLKQPREALEIYESILKNNPENNEVQLQLALCYSNLGRIEEARSIIEKMVQGKNMSKSSADRWMKYFNQSNGR